MIDVSKYTAHEHPGKFEGETPATEYFYEQAMNGDGEGLTDIFSIYCEPQWTADVFELTAEEREAFGIPEHHTHFLLRTDSQGFVYGSSHISRASAEKAYRVWLGV